ncbi:hypothetical protein BA195_06825 [Tenacibaculum soleae]|uniref:Uncharacterized protein n=1 Tax=Tenacibaculum soleae TaxID=447689 RepID=A0A1B9Y3H8_9FLAO|nr:hypothetical protein [Tenacibaculum soleae]OCK44385.1 hypothetical protein BA195_06825 [Tenacibaculum soleae]
MKKINLGSAANANNGDKIRIGGAKINDNFKEIITVLFGAQIWDGNVDENIQALLQNLLTTEKGSFVAALNSLVGGRFSGLYSDLVGVPDFGSYVKIKDRDYVLHKHTNNTDPSKKGIRQNNDIVYNVQWSATEVWQMAMCIDATKSADDRAAWNVINPIEGIPLI